MKQLTCELCGGNDLVKDGGFFVCQHCGTRYSVEEARKMMIEGTVDITGSTVKVDNTDLVQKYLANARRAKEKEDWEDTKKYYNLVEQNDPSNIEAIFYSTYAQVKVALLEAETKDKRQGVFNTLIKGVSVIDDNYDDSNEEHYNLLFEIYDDIENLKKGTIVPTTHLQEYVTKNGYGQIVDRNQVVENDPLSVTYNMIDKVGAAFEDSLSNIVEVRCKDWSEEKILEVAQESLDDEYPLFAFYYFKEYTKRNTDSALGYIGKAASLLGVGSYRASANEVAVASTKTVNGSDKEKIQSLIETPVGSLGRTLLINAAAFVNYEAVKYLIELGADVNAKSFNGESALWHLATAKFAKREDRENAIKCAKIVLDSGANADVTNKDGIATYTPKTEPEIASMIRAKFPTLQKGKAKGCYVATCVYGSYDCPEVWTLRRYRDNTLGATWFGRAFIHTYYAISPTLVNWFGNTNWFKKLWKGKLDRMVAKLQSKGVKDTPYEDKNW